MKKLTLCEHISLDGVIQHTADENQFAYSHWTLPYRTAEGFQLLVAAYGERYDLLLGRRTYDEWSNFWPTAARSPMADRLNAAKKYVVTHRPDSLAWGPAESLGQDWVAAVERRKAQDGPDLIVCGSSTLTSPLLEHGLADEVVLIVYPVLLGVGKRLFADGTPPRTLALLSTATTPAGVLLNRYRVAGPLTAK